VCETIWDSLSIAEQRELEARELFREEEMLSLGSSRYWRTTEDKKGKPEEAFIMEAGTFLYPAIETIRLELANTYEEGGAKRLPEWAPAFLWLSNEHILVLLLRTLLPTTSTFRHFEELRQSSCSKPWDKLQQTAARELSQGLWALCQYHEARDTFMEQWEKQSHYIKNWDNRQQRRFVKKVMKVPRLSVKARLALGVKLLEVAEVGGIVDRKLIESQDNSKLKRRVFYRLRPEILTELHARHDLFQWIRPKWGPMVSPPNDWEQSDSGYWTGGYYIAGMQMRFIRPATPGYDQLGLTKPGDVTVEAINTIQQTEYAINPFIHAAMSLVYKNNLELGDCPKSHLEDWAFPRFEGEERTHDGKLTKELQLHLKELEISHGEWHKSEADRLRMLERLALSKDLLGYDAYWLPITLDFRTRSYTSTEMVSPQGCDFDKALCCFAIKKPQTDRGRYWLKVHIANMFGIDKVSYDDRVAWVDENEIHLLACAKDPINNRAWIAADNKHKWQALAAIRDLYIDPEWTRVPVQRDGSCNGMQHWSALGRDPVGAKATNLQDAEKPEDLYTEVAEELLILLEADLKSEDPEKERWARAWLPQAKKNGRALTKRSCMTYPYGVTANGIQKALVNDNHCDWLSKDVQYKAAGYLTKKLLEAISKVVHSSYFYMQWIREVANVASAKGVVLSWPTPSGSIINHGYYEMETSTLNVSNQRVRFVIPRMDTGTICIREARNGVAPNFIHSLDAAHMQLTVVAASDEGLNCFSMIHDSYGVHAVDIDTLDIHIREQFFLMYSCWCPISMFIDALTKSVKAEVDDFPDKGEFDISLVKKARYFFS